MSNFQNDACDWAANEESAALEYILLGDLRDLLEEPVSDDTRQWLIPVLETLLGTLPREECAGDGEYLSPVLERYPNWYPQVDRLQREHRALFERLSELRNRLVRQQAIERIAEQLRADLRDWMAALHAHHRHENRILQTAINLEVGGGD